MHVFLIIIVIFPCSSFAQQGLIPSRLSVNVGYFSLLLPQSDLPCSVTEADSEQEAVMLQNSNVCPSNSSTDWNLFFDTSVPKLIVSVASLPMERFFRVLVVCCSSSRNSSASLSASIIFVDIPPVTAVNTSLTPTEGIVYPNPGYVNIAPCACNLTANMCDVNCCCDTECNDINFTCIPGPFGGNFTTNFPEFCDSNQFPLPDWHLFLCIQFLNTPDLGLFYPIDTNLAETEAAFNLRLLDNPIIFSYDDGISDAILSDVQAYMQDDPVLVLVGQNFEYLTLPQRSISGQCAINSVIGFLNDADANCDVTVSADFCKNNSILDVNSYLSGSSVIEGGSENVNVTVEYLCASSSSDYVKTTPYIPGIGSSFFQTSTTSSNLSSCTTPLNPPEESNGMCLNSVVSVTYTLTWNQTSITSVLASFVVADVPFSNIIGSLPNNLLSQSFRVRFEHITAASSLLPALSGNPGYNFGYPVISGNLNNSTISRTDQLRTWLPGGTGLCSESISVAPSFGQDAVSGCQLRLSFSDINNCESLRQLVEMEQTSLIGNNTYVSRFGNPNVQLDNDWLFINVSSLPPFTNSFATFGQCDGIPAHINILILTATSGRILGFPIREIVGIEVNWTRETWKLNCWGSDVCDENSTNTENFFVTSAINFVEIPPGGMIAKTLAEILDNTTCEKDATCWPELLLPLSQLFYYTMPLEFARQEIELNLVWTLLLVYFASGFFLLQLDWEKIGRYLKQQFPV